MVKTLDELKKMAEQHLSIELEMVKELTQLNFQDVMYFIPWYTHHQIKQEINERIKDISCLRNTPTTDITRQ